MDVDFEMYRARIGTTMGKPEVAVKNGERWKVMSNFVYGNSLDGGVDSGRSGGTLRSTNGAGQDWPNIARVEKWETEITVNT